ncbi:MAG: hypothetical protein A2Y10_06315 [Planctomycetes bacterium GWF2_41_51]|nr:MAG: hypothetical protein A2Y10_06315 [Planctomycetes bacterium GWF2_41_51]
MKTLNTILFILMAFGSEVLAEQTKSPAVMLQEGIYAEETEGNLDKAMEIYGQIRKDYNDVERISAKATYHLGMCHLKKGDKETAAKYFEEVVSYFPDQKSVAQKAQQQLDKLGIKKDADKNIFDILGTEAVTYIGTKYGEVCFEAGLKKLYSNSHIYVLDKDFILHAGGLGYIYNLTDKPIAEKYRIGGTSYRNQTLYDITGNKLDFEITQNYEVFWIPKEPLQPGGFFNYAWTLDESRKINQTESGYNLTMRNQFGDRCYETFFLAVPEGIQITEQSEEYTGKENITGWDIYWWKKEVPTNTTHVVNVTLAEETKLVQEMNNVIEPNGLIHFKNPQNHTNTGTIPITSTSFINSDFVNVTGMYYKDGRPINYTTTHKGNHFNYDITFDKPIQPGETVEGMVEGTIHNLINILPGTKDTWRYYMNHSPNSGVPTLRIETYLLPEGSELISTTPPDMQVTEKDGKIQLRVEKIIPAGGSLTTSFQYRITGAEPDIVKPLKIESAPWADGEVMELRLKHPTGNEYGTIIYSAQKNQNNWQIISHLYVSEASLSQYTFVEADAENFVPVYGQTTNWTGDFKAKYGSENVNLTINTSEKQTAKEISLDKTAYDNEQAVYLIRRMPLAEDYYGSFPIFTLQGGATVECRIKVLGIEDVTVEAGTFKCYKTDLPIFSQNIKALQHTLWFSTDGKKYLVKYDVGGTATMELAKVWQREIGKPIIFENAEPAFSTIVPSEWRYYKYGTGGQTSLQLLPPDNKAWAVLVWQKRGTDPDSKSAITIAKADSEKLKNTLQNYTAEQNSWKEFTVNNLQAAQYIASYEDSGNRLQKNESPKEMTEYRTYIVDAENVYWFVFRTEKDKLELNKAEFDSIINSFRTNAK